MEHNSLHQLLMEYRRTGTGKDKIFEGIARRMYSHPGNYGFSGEDDAADALLRYRDRIAGLPDRFEDRGVPFDVYLATCLRYLARTMRRRRRQEGERDFVCERVERLERHSEGETGWHEEFHFESDTIAEVAEGRRTKPPALAELFECICPAGCSDQALSNRLVFLLLKCAWEAGHEDCLRVAELSGTDPGFLGMALEQARRAIEPERHRLERLTGRRNAAWCRMTLLQGKIAGEANSGRRAKMEASLDRERGRFEKARAEIAVFRPIVPNSVVARILGVPKGTVDSGIYYLRKRLSESRT